METISKLFYKKLTGTGLSAKEEARLETWIAENSHNREAARRLSDLNHLEKEYRLRSIVDSTKALTDMRHRIAALASVSRRRRMVRFMSAAAVAVIVAGLIFSFLSSQSEKSDTRITAEAVETVIPVIDIDDIKHGKTFALLTDDSGLSLALDNTESMAEAKGLLSQTARLGERKIENLKLEVPRGGEFKITLEDSTEVWLNSESTLRYPEVFGPDERRVEVTGEAYFAVKPDATRPFYVIADNQKIRVYGTTFNIRSYLDDETILTTLESGSIAMTRLDGTGGELRLSPGHQAVFDKSDSKVTLRVVNPTIVTSWRNGKFVFDEQPLSTIMRDLARWYDFEYEFADSEVAKVVFKGSIPRYADFKEAIDILEYSGGIRFSVFGDRVIVKKRL